MTCAESIRVMHPLFQADQGGSIPTSALQLRVGEIEFDRAKELNRLWHSRLPAFTSPFADPCFAAEFDGVIYAVAMWSNPVARLLPQSTWLELRRLAIAPDAPKNTASWMLGVMRRLIRKQRHAIVRLVSYQDMDVHTGTIYAAAGWIKTTVSDGGNWGRPSRSRQKAQSEAAKQRWEMAT